MKAELPDLGLELDLYGFAYEYDSAAEAKRVWEQANEEVKGVSVWRMQGPQNPPYEHFYLICIGEEIANVMRTDAVLKQGSAVPFEPPEELMGSLARRRINQAVESVKRGDRTMKQESRTPEGRVLLPDGTMRPYKP